LKYVDGFVHEHALWFLIGIIYLTFRALRGGISDLFASIFEDFGRQIT
jgi:hypothetical protein